MPVIILIGTTEKYIQEFTSYFQIKYECCTLIQDFSITRSMLSFQDEKKLYLIPQLLKPERYEIYCLSRKNTQIFISVADSLNNTSCSSDKNILILSKFDGKEVEKMLEKSKIAPTTANKRSKCVSLKNLGELKGLFNKIKDENYKDIKNSSLFIFQECEERLIKMWQLNTQLATDEVKECYLRLVDQELKTKGIIKT